MLKQRSDTESQTSPVLIVTGMISHTNPPYWSIFYHTLSKNGYKCESDSHNKTSTYCSLEILTLYFESAIPTAGTMKPLIYFFVVAFFLLCLNPAIQCSLQTGKSQEMGSESVENDDSSRVDNFTLDDSQDTGDFVPSVSPETILADFQDEASKKFFGFLDQFVNFPAIFDNILMHYRDIFHFGAFPSSKLLLRGNNYYGGRKELRSGFGFCCRSPPVKSLTVKWFPVDSILFELLVGYFKYCQKTKRSLTFENCNFSPVSTEILKDFKFESLKVFKLINCSINESNLDRFLFSLPESVTHLHLCGIRWKGEKVKLKFGNFQKINKID